MSYSSPSSKGEGWPGGVDCMRASGVVWQGARLAAIAPEAGGEVKKNTAGFEKDVLRNWADIFPLSLPLMRVLNQSSRSAVWTERVLGVGRRAVRTRGVGPGVPLADKENQIRQPRL